MGPGTRLVLATALFLLACGLVTACGRLRLPEALRRRKAALEIALTALLFMSIVVHAWCLGVWAGRNPRADESTNTGDNRRPHMDDQQEFMKKLNEILVNLERIYAGEKPGKTGPGYSLASYATGCTSTSVAYETDGLSVCVRHDPDDDVIYGELRKEGWPDIKVEAPWHDEGDETAVTGMLFREAWKRTLPEQDR